MTKTHQELTKKNQTKKKKKSEKGAKIQVEKTHRSEKKKISKNQHEKTHSSGRKKKKRAEKIHGSEQNPEKNPTNRKNNPKKPMLML